MPAAGFPPAVRRPPPKGVDDVFSAVIVLLASVLPTIKVQKNLKVKEADRSWDSAKKSLLGNVNGLVDELKGYKLKGKTGFTTSLANNLNAGKSGETPA